MGSTVRLFGLFVVLQQIVNELVVEAFLFGHLFSLPTLTQLAVDDHLHKTIYTLKTGSKRVMYAAGLNLQRSIHDTLEPKHKMFQPKHVTLCRELPGLRRKLPCFREKLPSNNAR